MRVTHTPCFTGDTCSSSLSPHLFGTRRQTQANTLTTCMLTNYLSCVFHMIQTWSLFPHYENQQSCYNCYLFEELNIEKCVSDQGCVYVCVCVHSIMLHLSAYFLPGHCIPLGGKAIVNTVLESSSSSAGSTTPRVSLKYFLCIIFSPTICAVRIE